MAPPKGVPKPRHGLHAAGKPRPHCWITGTDPVRHAMYHPWQLAKAQAKFRGEEFTLTFDQYYNIWLPLWDQRGRKSGDMCMTRRDESRGWTKTNTVILTRKEHFETRSGRGADKKKRNKK